MSMEEEDGRRAGGGRRERERKIKGGGRREKGGARREEAGEIGREHVGIFLDQHTHSLSRHIPDLELVHKIYALKRKFYAIELINDFSRF